MSNSFYFLYKLIQKHPRLALLFAILFLLGSMAVIKQIQFNEDINKVIPLDEDKAKASNIISQLAFTDKIAVIFSKKDSSSTEQLSDAAQAFLDSLPAYQDYYLSVQGNLDEELFNSSFQFINRHLPIYLDEADYHAIEQKIQADSIRKQVESNYQTLMGMSAGFMKDIIIQDPLQLSFLALKKLQQFQGNSDYSFEDGFLFSKDKSKLFLFINPKYSGTETKHNEVFVDSLRSLQQQLAAEFPQIETRYFGSPFIAVANAKQIKQDILYTIVISVSLLMLLLIFYYRSCWVPLIVMLPSVFGGLFGLICLYFIKSEISAISLSISAILIGITIDYALHYLTHSKGSQNQKQLFKDVSRPLLMSSSTTAIAFLCLLFVRSEALVDLGIFASIAVVATALFTLIILPHIYKGGNIKQAHIIDRIARYPFEKNKGLIGLSLLLLILSLFTYHRVRFDGDLSKINYIPQDQQEAEKILNHGQENQKSLFLVTYANSQEEALKQNEVLLQKLKSAKLDLQYQSINQLVPSPETQAAALARWQQFWTPDKVKNTIDRIERESGSMGFMEQTHLPFYQSLTSKHSTVNLDSIKVFNEQFYREFVHGKGQQSILSTLVNLAPKDRDQFAKTFEAFMVDKPMLLVDRQALNEQYLSFLINDFNSLVSYSFVAVLFILFVFYKRIELVIVAAIPIALTGFITAGLMGLLQVPFNIFSSIVCTLVFGHGIDFSIFMTSALQKEYSYGKNEMPIYRTSIILAVLTTILAIGALIFAQHPALRSISSIALIGVSVAVLVTFVLYPILYKFLFFNRIKKGLSPITLGLLLQAIFLFGYFALASIFVSVFIRSFTHILPISKTRKQLFFAKLLSAYMRSVLYLKLQVQKRVFHAENFHKAPQTVFIANHSSFLDSLSIAMVYYKLVFLVNDWVYNSPIFGRAVRFLDFFPTSAGLEAHIPNLQQRIGQEFSLAVFPEGTRSTTSEIHRFHKGAFLLAQELNLPISPVYLHGNADSLPKGDFIIYDGICHIHVGEPIDPQDTRFGTDNHQKAKNMAAFFRENFKQIRLKNEDASYFKKKLFLNYRYHEGDILHQVKVDFNKHKNTYYQLFKQISDKAKIAHISGDYGQVDFLLVHQFPTRKISSYLPEEAHADIARSSYITQKFQLSYVQDPAELWPKKDTLILSHLADFNAAIPAHIQEIVVLCCSFRKEFVDFHKKHEEENLLIYARNERNAAI